MNFGFFICINWFFKRSKATCYSLQRIEQTRCTPISKNILNKTKSTKIAFDKSICLKSLLCYYSSDQHIFSCLNY